jgi:pentatricopeptide repeat protein
VRTDDAAERAEALLDRLLALYRETSDGDMKPTESTFNAVISAWARSRHEQSAEHAEDVFQRLYDFFEPDTYSYNSLINAYAKKGHALNAMKLLKRMEVSSNNGNTAVRPDEVTFNTVIYALSKSSRQGSAEEAEALLERMETLYKGGRTELKPTPTTYTTVISAWTRSTDVRKAERARKILDAMIKGYRAGDASLKPDVKAFTSVINACSRTDLRHDDQIRSALRLAIQTFEEMKNSPEYDDANAVTYRALIKACSHLATDPAERSRLLQSIFQQCCYEGMLSKQFLDTLKRTVSDEDLARLKIGGTLPFEWSRNVSRREHP